MPGNRSQGISFPSQLTGVGAGVTSSTSTGQWTELDPLTGLYRTPGLTIKENGTGPTVQTVFSFSTTPMILADAAGTTGWGFLDLYDFPEGHIMFTGAVLDLAITATTLGVDVDYNGDIALGTAINTGVTPMTGTKLDLIPTTATPQATTVDSLASTTGDAVSTVTENAPVDGTATALSMWLNVLIDDGDQDITATPCNLLLTGTLIVTWTNLGNN